MVLFALIPYLKIQKLILKLQKNVFKSLPRYSQRYTPDVFLSGHHSRAKLPCIRRALKIRTNSPDFTRWINVRHPFSRLLSAWRQKFDKAYSGVESYYKYVDKIRPFEERDWKKDATHVVSLEAFLSYVANVASDHYYNEHWRRYLIFPPLENQDEIILLLNII